MKRIAVVVLLTALGSPFSARAGQFRHAEYYQAGKRPNQVIAADFNNDGNLDLAVANYLASEVDVLLGKGNGKFERSKAFSVPAAIALAAGDFNGDGNEDLAVVQYGGTGNSQLAIFLGDGTGKFKQSSVYVSGVASYSVALGDFNGDGRLDAAVANAGSGDVSVFFGDGTGKLRNPKKYRLLNAVAIAVADLNGDHHPDLAVAYAGGGGVAVLLNDGTGKFGKLRLYPLHGTATGVAIADLNNDGRPDLAVANSQTNNIAVFLNIGHGKFGPPTLNTSGAEWGSGSDTVVIADFNQDGIPDLAVANQNGNSALLYGKGNGKFKPLIQIKEEINFDGAMSLVAGDFNGDRAPDLALPIFDDGKVAIMINTK